MPFAFAAGPRPARTRLGLKPHRRTLLRLIPIYTEPQRQSSRHPVPIDNRFAPLELGHLNQPSHNGRRHYPHSARRTTERTWPAVSLYGTYVVKNDVFA
jgi:hypothetical protein